MAPLPTSSSRQNLKMAKVKLTVDELSKLGRGAKLLVLARDEQAGDINARGIAAFELGKLGLTSELLALGQDTRISPLVCENAAFALTNLEHVEDGAGILFTIVQDEKINAEDRMRVVGHLRCSFHRLDEIYPLMVALARSEQSPLGLRMKMVDALGRFKRADDLRALAWDEVVNAKVRVRAGEWLSQLGHKGGAQQPLIELVLDKRVDPDAQRMALRNFGLSKIEQDARKHADKEVRQLLERVAERSRQLMGSDGDSSL